MALGTGGCASSVQMGVSICSVHQQVGFRGAQDTLLVLLGLWSLMDYGDVCISCLCSVSVYQTAGSATLIQHMTFAAHSEETCYARMRAWLLCLMAAEHVAHNTLISYNTPIYPEPCPTSLPHLHVAAAKGHTDARRAAGLPVHIQVDKAPLVDKLRTLRPGPWPLGARLRTLNPSGSC